MPTTYAHYRLGEEVRKQLPKSIQNVINEAPQLFHFGVHGPDHLFYYNPLMKTSTGMVGTTTHKEPAAKFFVRAAKTIHKCENKAAHCSYIYGYLCHFAMDYVCHGYIGQQMEKTGLSHYEIEAEYDRRLLLMDGYDKPVRICVTGHLHPSKENAAIIADFYDDVSDKQVLQSLKGMTFYLNLLRAPSMIMRKILFTMMKMVGMYKTMCGLVMNYEENPTCTETTDELVRRFEVASKLALELITEYEKYLQQGGVLSETFCYNFDSELCK